MKKSESDDIPSLHVSLTDKQTEFVESKAPNVALIGPEGEGKTYAGFAALIRHAQERVEISSDPVRGFLIRDTFENVLTKTRPSIEKAILTIARDNNSPDLIHSFTWHRGGKIMACEELNLVMDFFGGDSNADVARLQGGDQWSFGWLEEPAPMYAGGNAGLPRAVFNAALSRAARGGGSMRLQTTMNPADEEHWTYDAFVKNPIMRPSDMPDIWTEVFFLAYGENPKRTDLQRQATKAAYRDDPAMYARLVEGKFAFVQVGEKVTPEYQDIHHLAAPGRPYHFEIKKGWRGFRSWDGGHNPTCLIGQISPAGRIHFIHGLILPRAGMKQFIDSRVKPLLQAEYRDVTEWLDTGDPSLIYGDQSDIEKSPAGVIENALDTNFDPAVHWPLVREPMKEALNLMIDGKPFIRVDGRCDILHKALRGGWHFPKLNSGLVLRDKPEKDVHSHPGDCFGALVYKLIGNTGEKRKRAEVKQAGVRSYA